MNQADNIYRKLGVTPLINAAGTFTDLGGSLMPPEVVSAWAEAARHYVDLRELQDTIGERIAQLLNVEAALVIGGAASGILLGTAAAITLRDPNFLRQCVASPDGRPYEVLRQKSHRDIYDRQVESCGVKIVEVERDDDVRRLVSDRAILMFAYNLYEPTSPIKHDRWLQLATEYSIPTLLDAAADVPPVENLRRYCQLGYDLVTFSGGKAIQGPPGTGLLIGRTHLIEAVKLNAMPNEGTIGRVAKVGKEDIVAFYKALETFLTAGDQISRRCLQQLQTIENLLQGVAGLRCRYLTPQVANHFPHLVVEWDEVAARLTRDELAAALRYGEPAIATGRVYGTGNEGLLVSAVNLAPGEERIVGERIREILCGSSS